MYSTDCSCSFVDFRRLEMKNWQGCQCHAGRPSYGKKKIGQTGSGNPTTVATSTVQSHALPLPDIFSALGLTAHRCTQLIATQTLKHLTFLLFSAWLISQSHARLPNHKSCSISRTTSHLRGRWLSQPFGPFDSWGWTLKPQLVDVSPPSAVWWFNAAGPHRTSSKTSGTKNVWSNSRPKIPQPSAKELGSCGIVHVHFQEYVPGVLSD